VHEAARLGDHEDVRRRQCRGGEDGGEHAPTVLPPP
jgi:hypothetical protein